MYRIDSVEGAWNSARFEEPNLGYKPSFKGGYFPVSPDRHVLTTCAARWSTRCGRSASIVEAHHHEVATAGQSEIDMRFQSLLKMSDQVMWYKYICKNVAKRHGKTVTFMPKPIFEDNGSGMHTHISLWKGGKNLFAGHEVRRPERPGAARHRRHPQARAGDPGLRRADDELLSPPGARLRGPGQPVHVRAQPLRRVPHPDVLRRTRRPSASSSAAPTRAATRT